MLGVFLHHLWKTVIQTPVGPFQWGLDVLFDTASDGVILFNVLSGFLLALPYLGPQRRPFVGYGNFLHRRFLRIVPSYFLALVLFSLANVLVFGIPPVSALHNLLWHLSFLNSLEYSMMSTNFSHFWYLGMLAQFYLLFPLFLRFFQRVGSTGALIRIVGVCWGGWSILSAYLAWYPDSALGMAGYLMHFNLPGRLPEFAVGMWLASRWTSSGSPLRTALLPPPLPQVLPGLAAGLIVGAPLVGGAGLPLAHIYHVMLCGVLVLVLLLWEPVRHPGQNEPGAEAFSPFLCHLYRPRASLQLRGGHAQQGIAYPGDFLCADGAAAGTVVRCSWHSRSSLGKSAAAMHELDKAF